LAFGASYASGSAIQTPPRGFGAEPFANGWWPRRRRLPDEAPGRFETLASLKV
jgi:hypothetical protein